MVADARVQFLRDVLEDAGLVADFAKQGPLAVVRLGQVRADTVAIKVNYDGHVLRFDLADVAALSEAPIEIRQRVTRQWPLGAVFVDPRDDTVHAVKTLYVGAARPTRRLVQNGIAGVHGVMAALRKGRDVPRWSAGTQDFHLDSLLPVLRRRELLHQRGPGGSLLVGVRVGGGPRQALRIDVFRGAMVRVRAVVEGELWEEQTALKRAEWLCNRLPMGSVVHDAGRLVWTAAFPLDGPELDDAWLHWMVQSAGRVGPYLVAT